MKKNILLPDSYKGSHYLQYPKDAVASRSYVAPRKPLSYQYDQAVIIGFVDYIEKYLQKLTQKEIDEAFPLWDAYGIAGASHPFPREAVKKIVANGGVLPVNIYGVQEGTVINEYNSPVAVIEATDPEFVWLPSFLETAFQRAIWYPSTVASNSRNIKLFLASLYEKTVDPDFYWTIDYRLHDFGERGASSGESAEIGGMAHLVNFLGSDTTEAAFRIKQLYPELEYKDIACSIPASEHSSVTTWGSTFENELESLDNMIETYGTGMFAFVSDSYDFKRMVDQGWGDPKRIARIRELGGFPVVRPDSGDPEEMVMYALNSLGNSWGYTINGKGYKVLNGIAVIQGDGMNPSSIKKLYNAVVKAGWSPQNLACGMGGGLLQDVRRDDQSWSQKTFQVLRNGIWENVQKNPVTQKDKIGWNPNKGINFNGWVAYYKGASGKPMKELPMYVKDFKAVRKLAAVFPK